MQEFFFKYVAESDSFCAISYRGDESEVVIPAFHWGKPVTVLMDDLFKHHSEITSIQIPDSVLEIGGFVFDGCSSLRQISLPSRLESMWQYAFVRSSIEEIVIPDGVTQLVPYTFKDCRDLRRIVCGSGMQRIYASAFDGCTALNEIVHEADVQIIGSNILIESKLSKCTSST